MKAQLAKKLAAVAFSAVLATGLVPFAAPYGALAADGSASAPTVDGSLSEWSGIAKQTSTDSDVDYWQVAKDSDGNVYLAISGTADNGYYFNWQWNSSKAISFTLNGSKSDVQLGALEQGWAALKGGFAYENHASGNSAGPVYVEVKLNASSFKGSSDYSITFAGTTVKASDIPTFSASKADDTPATYNGIAIDGKFSDWDAVEKTETSDPNDAHKNNLAAEAMVFDGDNVYIYIEEGKGGDATGAGTHSNGQFAITTDLGNTLMVQLRSNEVTAGGKSVEFEHVGRQWEIAVPKSMLPSYQKTISFGLYLQDPTVKDVANLDTSDNGNVDNRKEIVFDGDYSKWDSYPHTLIQYSTAGTQENVPDGEAALYSNDGMLYSHVKTTMNSHLSEKGSEFLQGVTYRFADDGSRDFYPRFVEVDASGNIISTDPRSLSNGDHEFYIIDSQGWGVNVGQNVNNLQGNAVYGKIKVTVNGSVDQCESVIYLDKIAEKFNCSADDFKNIQGQWGRIGQQWVSTAGTPTDPWLGTGIAIASVLVVVGGYALYRRRKQGARAAAASANGASGAEAADAAQTQEQAR